MKTTINEFLKRVDTLLREPGILEKRAAWPTVKAGAASLLPFSEVALSQLPPAVSTIFILAATAPGPKRNAMLRTFFQTTLLKMPDDELIKLLSKLSQAELRENLVPYIYEPGNRGSVSCFIAARLRVSVATEAFQYFLSARPWNQTDLMNLSLLVKSEDSPTLCSVLETMIATADNKITRDNMTEFRQIVFNHLGTEAMIPELAEAQAVQTPDKIEEVAPPPPVAKATVTASTAGAAPAGQAKPEPSSPMGRAPQQSTASSPLLKPENIQVNLHLPESIRRLAMPVGLVALFLSIGMLYTLWHFDDASTPTVSTRPDRTSGKTPSQWVDSVTQRPVTAKYLAADRDYRMGELFLTRDRYSEALKLFEDALSIDPEHFQALARAGFCRMQLGDNKKAAEIFKQVLARQPGHEMVNLYLARICIANNDLQAAEKHFKTEFNLNSDLTVGLELANFYARNGKHNEAMELIATLQEQHPGKHLVLANDAASAKNSTAGGQK